MKQKILVFDSKPYDIEFLNKENVKFNFNLKFLKSHITEETIKLAKGYDAICAFVNDEINKNIIDFLYDIKVPIIALRSAGYNNVNFKAAFKKIHVFRVPSYSPSSVAEHTIALIMTLNRKTHKAYYRTRDNNFNINGLIGFNMENKKIGVIGTGKIGVSLIKILKGFGCHVLAYDVYPNNKLASDLGFSYVSLDILFKESDVISLNCPLTKETYHLINNDSISKMKNGVFIINTGRGKLIDTKALIQGLKTKKIGAAGLDVYEEESEYFFEDFSNEIIEDDTLARLLTFSNVLVTSHQGFFTKEAMTNIAYTTLKNIDDFFKDKSSKNEICYKCLESKDNCSRALTGRCF